jgi:Putative adhesin
MNASRLALIALATAAIGLAQDKVSVPISNPSQPVTVKVTIITGNITVVGGSGSQVTVESQDDPNHPDRPRRERESTPPPGMHRLDVGGGGLDVQEEHNIVTVKAGMRGMGGNLTIQVPVNASVELKSVTGKEVSVSGINGDMDVECTNGAIILKDVSGSANAHTINGSITVNFAKVTGGKPMSFTSLNGKVDVTLPGDTKARLRLKTQNGAVYSDFDVKMEADAKKPVIEDERSKNALAPGSTPAGKYRIYMDRSVYGSINGGGPEFLFQTMNGDILIHKK